MQIELKEIQDFDNQEFLATPEPKMHWGCWGQFDEDNSLCTDSYRFSTTCKARKLERAGHTRREENEYRA